MYHLAYHSTILLSAHTVYLCVSYVSQNKQRLFPYATLTDWFLKQIFIPLKPSGHSLYVSPGLSLNNSAFSPHGVFMCFVCISEQTAIISLYNINWLVFITETECVYCAVRTESLYLIHASVCSCNITEIYTAHPYHVII